jgi:class 3 adenylate cyclase
MALTVWHVRAHPPGGLAFFARADDAGALPHVTRLLGGPAEELRVGDQLVAVGGRDLRGAGSIRVLALVYAARVEDPAARLEILRDGQPLSIGIPTTVATWASWWAGLAFSASLGLSGLLLLLRARSWHLPRRYFVAVMLWSIALTTTFVGAGGGWTYLGFGLLLAFLGPAAALNVWNMLEWTPSALPLRAWHKALPWGVLALGLAFAWSHAMGRSEIAPEIRIAMTGATAVAVLYGIYRCYRRADAGERRQLRWAFYGFGLAFGVLLLSSVVPLLAPAIWLAEHARLIFNAVLLSAIAVPIGLMISIAGYQYLDIDRLISGTAAAAILAAALAGGAFTVVPPVAHAAGTSLGIEPGTVQLVLSMALAALLGPAYQRIHPRVERRLFPEREAVGAGFAQLLDELSACRDAGELTRIASERTDALLRPESIVTYAREGEAYTPIFARGRALPPAFDASAPLVSALRARSGPLAADRFVRQSEKLSPFDRAALDTLEVAVISPTHRRGDLIAFQCLGPKRSGDIYTATDLALLAALSSKVADLIARFDDATTLHEAREMQAALRRYVPGAVAREIGEGTDLSSGEREVSVLFVDIRGYTQLAERLDADQIFSTLNRHTEEVSTIVGQHGGSVVEFHGDGLMAVFGAPRAIERKEACAVAAAREIIAKLETRELSVGIGVATGSAYVGDIQSSADRRIWSVVGNTTNLAARLQALTRDLDAVIAADATTRERAGAACAGFLLHRAQRIRGRSEPIDLWVLPLEAPAAKRRAAT